MVKGTKKCPMKGNIFNLRVDFTSHASAHADKSKYTLEHEH